MYEDVRSFVSDLKQNWSFISQRFQFAASRFFYKEDFASLILFNKTYNKLPKDAFIDYNAAFTYYQNNHQKWVIVKNNEEREIIVPYQDLVNFIDEPDAKVKFEGDIGEFKLDAQIAKDTDQAFEAFITEKPRTTNGKIARLAGFQKISPKNYAVKVENAGYFDSVRTNLSLDHQLDSDTFSTLRLKELSKTNDLLSLENSNMANGIGVSSALAFQSKGIWYFHMQPRTANLGVFSNMLSSVGGVLEPPATPKTDFVEYAKSEIKRELKEETGIDIAELKEHSRFDIIPLALTRELTRGGKPEFFFLTVMGELTDKEFAKVFKNAKWKNEFRNDFFSNITALDDVLSPGFSTNLLYALRYMQVKKRIKDSRLILP